MEGILFIIIFLCIVFIRVVPSRTIVIIDRNSHYLKTRRFGIYFFNPKTDKITSQISLDKTKRFYNNNYETHDGEILQISFNAEYHAEKLDDVIDALASNRRSIDDVMESSIYWAARNLTYQDIVRNTSTIYMDAKQKLTSEALELGVIIDSFKITSINKAVYSRPEQVFKPHTSRSSESGPLQYH